MVNTSMNLSNIMTRLKLKVGLINIATPFENLDDVLLQIVQEITVPVFSIYYPYKMSIPVNIHDYELLEKTDNYEKFLLPDFQNQKLLYVFDVNYDDSVLAGLGYYGGGYPLMMGNLIDQTMLSNAGASVMNMMIPKITFKFEPPRALYIYNAYSSSKMIIDLGFEHDKSLATIPDTCREEFLKLATLDVKENLYPTLKQYTELNTAIGNINLKLDDWQNADDQRRDLIEKWDDTYHLDFKPLYYV
jgi:hypothetical protein